MADIDAPICVVPVQTPISDQPGKVKFQSIPQPHDLPSLIVAVNAIRQTLMQLIGQVPLGGPGGFNLGAGMLLPSFGGGLSSDGSGGASKLPKDPNERDRNGNEKTGEGRFVEDKRQRVTVKKKVYNPEDHDQWIEIKVINRVVWVDRLTGQTIVWTR